MTEIEWKLFQKQTKLRANKAQILDTTLVNGIDSAENQACLGVIHLLHFNRIPMYNLLVEVA